MLLARRWRFEIKRKKKSLAADWKFSHFRGGEWRKDEVRTKASYKTRQVAARRKFSRFNRVRNENGAERSGTKSTPLRWSSPPRQKGGAGFAITRWRDPDAERWRLRPRADEETPEKGKMGKGKEKWPGQAGKEIKRTPPSDPQARDEKGEKGKSLVFERECPSSRVGGEMPWTLIKFRARKKRRKTGKTGEEDPKRAVAGRVKKNHRKNGKDLYSCSGQRHGR